MCGPSGDQKDLAKLNKIEAESQAKFNLALISDFQSAFGDSKHILDSLTTALTPIVSAGPNQYGFSAAEDAAKRGEVIDTAGQVAQDSQVALGAQESARGGEAFQPSGAKEQLSQQANLVADQSKAQGLRDVTNQGYDTGRQNFFNAEGALVQAPQVLNPATSLAGAANSSGNTANDTTNTAFSNATKIREMQTAWLKPVLGAVGAVVGGPAGASLGSKIGAGIGGAAKA